MKFFRYLLCMICTVSAGLAFATTDYESFEYDTLDVTGDYQERSSAADRLKKMRAQLEKKNELMIKKKIEDVRLKQEIELNKKLMQKMNQLSAQLDQLDS